MSRIKTDDEPNRDDAGANGGPHPEAPAHRDPAGTDKDEQPDKPPFYKRPIPMLILSIVVIGGILAGVLYWLHSRQFESTDDAFIEGHIIPVSARVAGQVLELQIDDNMPVKERQLLLRIDPVEFETKVKQAQADLQSARSKLEEAQANVKMMEANLGTAQAAEASAATEAQLAQADLQRLQGLDARAVSRQQLDTVRANAQSTASNLEAARKKTAAAKAQVDFSQTQVKTAESQIEASTAGLRQANIQLEHTNVVAPEAGLVTRRTVEPGAYVQPGQALLAIVPEDVWVIANFKETQLLNMKPGDAVDIEVDAFSHADYHGKVQSVQKGTGSRFSLLPPENATGNYVKVVQRVPVKIVFDGDQDLRRLAPGMSVKPKVRVR